MEMWLSYCWFSCSRCNYCNDYDQKTVDDGSIVSDTFSGAILVGGAADIPAYLTAGINKVAANGVMFVLQFVFGSHDDSWRI